MPYIPEKPHKGRCKSCHKPFTGIRGKQFCNDTCRKRYSRSKEKRT